MTEKALQQAVMDCARAFGWLAFHPYDSRRSTPGYPDCTLVRDGRLILAELKVGRGQLRPEQRVWLARLVCVPGVSVYVWREANWLSGEIERVLR
jgi:hypothetical protein